VEQINQFKSVDLIVDKSASVEAQKAVQIFPWFEGGTEPCTMVSSISLLPCIS